MPLVCIGLNHASAPLDVRGRLALGPSRRRELLLAEWFREGARTVGVLCDLTADSSGAERG